MSRRRAGLRSAGLAALALAAAPGAAVLPASARAQEAAAAGPAREASEASQAAAAREAAPALRSEEALRARLDSLRPLLEEARREVEAYRAGREARQAAAAAETAAIDTLRIGLMTVLTPVGQGERARELFTEVWAERFADVSASPALSSTPFTFQWSADLVSIHVATRPAHRIENRRYTSRDRVKRQIRGAIATSLALDLEAREAGLSSWLVGAPHDARAGGDVYRELATSPSGAARDCLSGSTADCLVALELETVDDPLRAWYTPEERRALVGAAPAIGARRDQGQRWMACVEDASAEACYVVLASAEGSEARWAPLRTTVRSSLVAHALAVGGDGSWARLFEEAASDPLAALEHASGVGIEALLDGWRARVVADRPEVYAGLLPKSGLALLWFFLFTAFATRSTRWRLG